MHFEAYVAFSIGLEVFASVVVSVFVTEVLMNHSFALVGKVMACVWCGIAFLRRLSGERKFQPKRGMSLREDVWPAKSERGGSIPPLRAIFFGWPQMRANHRLQPKRSAEKMIKKDVIM